MVPQGSVSLCGNDTRSRHVTRERSARTLAHTKSQGGGEGTGAGLGSAQTPTRDPGARHLRPSLATVPKTDPGKPLLPLLPPTPTALLNFLRLAGGRAQCARACAPWRAAAVMARKSPHAAKLSARAGKKSRLPSSGRLSAAAATILTTMAVPQLGASSRGRLHLRGGGGTDRGKQNVLFSSHAPVSSCHIDQLRRRRSGTPSGSCRRDGARYKKRIGSERAPEL